MEKFYRECPGCCLAHYGCECEEETDIDDCSVLCNECTKEVNSEEVGKDKTKWTCKLCEISEIELNSERN